jgi:hypothetical protein
MIYIAAMLFALKTPNIDLAHPQKFLYGYFKIEVINGIAHNTLSYIGIILLLLGVAHLLLTTFTCFYLRARFTKPLLINSFVIGSFTLVFFGLITGLPVAFDKEYLALFNGNNVTPIDPTSNDRT